MLRGFPVVIVAIGFATSSQATELAARLAAKNSVTAEEIGSHAAVLANDTFEGREAGSRGGRAAAGYLVEQFEKIGLDPAGIDGGYTQSFNGSMRNILAILPGSDPVLSKEVILIGAHYDHVGYGTRSNSFGPLGRIHNGADDNASGTSALLEAAQGLKMLAGAHRRSILIALWDGEEKGLLGSQHWLLEPTVARSRIRCAINLDMVGRLRQNKLEVYGVRTAPDLRRLISMQNGTDGLTLDYLWKMQEDSDHYNFFRYSIPSLMFHTGKHDDYHRPSDDTEKLNLDGVQSVTRLLIDVAVDLADADELPAFRVESAREGRDERQRSTLEAPLAALPGRLGLTWKAEETSERGLVVSSVFRRTPAATAGIVVGDRIVSWNGEALSSNQRFQQLVSTETEPATLAIVGRIGGEPREVQVTLEGPPIRIGITWVRDEAEPRCVLIKRVVPTSPAERAGLLPVDRIYAVNDEEFTTGEDFEKLLFQDRRKLELTVERDGKILRVPLVLDEAPAGS